MNSLERTWGHSPQRSTVALHAHEADLWREWPSRDVLAVHEILGRPCSDRTRAAIEQDAANASIDYEGDALEFNQTYFLRNALKCSATVRMLDAALPDIGRRTVLDVGGGVGTFSIAAHLRWPNAKYVVVDRARKQCDLGRALAAKASVYCVHEWKNDEATALFEPPPQLALFSYCLCESPWLLASARSRGINAALVTDYGHVLDDCERMVRSWGGESHRRRAVIELGSELAVATGQESLLVEGGLLVWK